MGNIDRFMDLSTEERRKIKEEKYHGKMLCPRCHHPNNAYSTIKNGLVEEPVLAKTDDRGYAIDQVAYNIFANYICDGCGKVFEVDLGESRYSIFKEPRACTNTHDIRILAKFESEYEDNFYLYIAKNPSCSTEFIYFIDYENDSYPYFISKEVAEEYLKNHKRALSFLHCESMTRYR